MALPLNELETVAFTAHRSITERLLDLQAREVGGVDLALAEFLHLLVTDYIEDRVHVLPLTPPRD